MTTEYAEYAEKNTKKIVLNRNSFAFLSAYSVYSVVVSNAFQW